MSDPTTHGLAAAPADVEGMVRNLCAYALGEPDPIQRYEDLTQQQVLFEGMVEALRRERGRLVADLVVAGRSVTDVAAQTSLATVVKVRRLISDAGQLERVQEATAARKAAAPSAVADVEPPPTEVAKVAEAKVAEAADAVELPEVVELPAHLATPEGKRLLTEADRAALGLSAESKPLSQQGAG